VTAAVDGFSHRQVTVGGGGLHVVEAGDPGGQPFVFLHGWPESWRCWQQIMSLAAGRARVIAVDLPGVGESAGAVTDGSKVQLAGAVHELITTLGLTDVTLVGHDIGGMVTYAYLRAYRDIARAVIMDIVLPGVPPWEEFLRAPFLWHFALHAVPGLPERLVQDRQRDYFAYFYTALAADPAAVTQEARRAYEAAYGSDEALAAGFGWFRAFSRDAADNRQSALGPAVTTPLLYLRGERERGGDIGPYADGLRGAGVPNVTQAVVPGAGHFTQEEAPGETWRLIAGFAGL
jgi:pimeloyl-ACP methyl ester carboxylesterase